MDALAPVLVTDLFPLERQQLLQLLTGLEEEEWFRPTVCAGWTVKDIALHVLGDDLSLLSRKRDAFDLLARKGNLDSINSWSKLVAYLNESNELWVQAMRRISSNLTCSLLEFSGKELSRYFASLDPFAIGEPVSWAGPDPAPVWLDIAREYSERWLHQQHIRDAVAKPGLKDQRFFAPVLNTFVRALPHTLRDASAPNGTHVQLTISGESGGDWCIRRQEGAWGFVNTASMPVAAHVVIDRENAWRLFTKGVRKDEVLQHTVLSGDQQLCLKVLAMVSIIA